jgi:Icc-related predicted phosphoesterase
MPAGAPAAPARDTVRIAALGDVHYGTSSQGALQPLFAEIGQRADVLLLCGDVTNHGLPDEARLLTRDLAAAKIPVLAVLGNHEYESGKEAEVSQILAEGGAQVLDGEACEVLGIGFVGLKGFGGGFGERALQAWGEGIVKQFVHEAVNEALKLESALARLHTAQRVVLLHYSPVAATVEGEPREVYPFLGSSRLEEPLTHYPVAAIFHGHAHHGRPEGATRSGVPVYNVALPVLQRAFPDQSPFRLIELPVAAPAAAPAPAA